MNRRSLTQLQRVRIFDAHEGFCNVCFTKIHASRGAPFEIDHIKPLWLGGDDDESNMQPVHRHCHSGKTSSEAPVRAKS